MHLSSAVPICMAMICQTTTNPHIPVRVGGCPIVVAPVRVGGCLTIVAQAGDILGLTSGDCQPFHFPLFLPHNI